MGRLQDNQYAPLQQKKKKQNPTKLKEEREKSEAKLQSTFSPPLDPSLIRAIWNDSFNYDVAFETLSSLAGTAETQVAESFEQLEIAEPEDDNVTFLVNCFPSLPVQDLVETLAAEDNDLEKATDVLLNRDYLDATKPKKKANKKIKATVWSSGQLPTVSASHTTTTAGATHNMRRIMETQEALDELASVPFNVWHQYDVVVADLERFFVKVPKMNIATCVQRCRGNVIASVKLLMERYPEQKPEHELSWPDVKLLTQIKSELEAIMVDRSSEDVARVALGVVLERRGQNRSVEQLVQLGVEHFLSFDVHQIDLEARLAKMAKESEIIRAKIKKREMPVIPDYLLINNQNDYVEEDAEECRDIAMQLILERNELFRKAAAAYRQARNKGPGEGGIAFYYSDTARQIDSQAKDWNMRAARAAVRQQRLRQRDDHLLDLHGLTVAEAQVVVKEGLTQWYSRSQMQSSRIQFQPLKIITGAGKHSQYGESKLLPTTLKILKKENWLYEMPHKGCIYVKGVKN